VSRQRASTVVLFGTGSAFSATVAQQLLDVSVDLRAVVVPGPAPATSAIPVIVPGQPETPVSLAGAKGVPVRYADDLMAPDLHRWLAALSPEFILVACFPHRLPEALCALATRDCLNLHPSLLPRYRGPTPLFWQLRAGERETGVTLHRVTPRIDAGEIVLQARALLPDGVDETQADQLLAERGARLFVDAVALYRSGEPPLQAQEEAASSYYGRPGDADFRVSSAWSARRVFNFIRGTKGWRHPYPISIGGRDYRLSDALDFTPEARQERPVRLSGNEAHIQCSPGVLHALVEGQA